MSLTQLEKLSRKRRYSELERQLKNYSLSSKLFRTLSEHSIVCSLAFIGESLACKLHEKDKLVTSTNLGFSPRAYIKSE